MVRVLGAMDTPNPLDIEPQAPAASAFIDGMATGSFGIRLAGRLIDTLVGGAMGFVGGIIGVVVAGLLAAMGQVESNWLEKIQSSGGGFVASALWGGLASLLYHSVSEGVGGTSVGKLILGFRVVREDLHPVGFGSAVIRSLAYFVDAFFFGMPAYQSMQNGPYNQRLGDKWGKTVVIKASAIPENLRRSTGLMLLGLACGMSAQALVMALSMISKVM